MTVKAKTATVKYSKLKKKSRSLAVKKVIIFTKTGQGKMTYKLVSAKKGKKSFKKYFSINKMTGKVTIPRFFMGIYNDELTYDVDDVDEFPAWIRHA